MLSIVLVDVPTTHNRQTSNAHAIFIVQYLLHCLSVCPGHSICCGKDDLPGANFSLNKFQLAGDFDEQGQNVAVGTLGVYR